VSGILRERLYFSSDVAAYGLHHRDAAAMQDFLENSSLIHNAGDWLDSPLLSVRP
jgi:hypothetical protein